MLSAVLTGIMADITPTPEQAEQKQPPAQAPSAPVNAVPTSGKRTAFLDIKRQLLTEDLNHPGTQKLILDLLITTESERDDLRVKLESYVPLYHACDKRVGVLEEKLKTNKVNEIMFGVGVGIGCAMIGLAPFFWDPKPIYGEIMLVVGLLVTLGAAIARIVFK